MPKIHGWYPITMLVLVFVGISVLNVWFTVHVNDERQYADRRAAAEARAADRRAAEEAQRVSRANTCKLVIAFDDLYKETPPSSPAGINVAALWASYRLELGC